MNHFGMFVKYWEPTRVKTRLAQGVGAQQAAEVYRLFVVTLWERFASVGDCRQLVYTPASRQAEIKRVAPAAWQMALQAEGDLGRRMHCYFEQAFQQGAQRVVLIGSDSPLLPLDYVEQAFELLGTHELVLGPSDDGGYYLVGAAGSTPPIFSAVDWSTPSVLEQTLALAEAAGVHTKLLPTWYDIDHRDDLARLSERLKIDDQWPQLREAVHVALKFAP